MGNLLLNSHSVGDRSIFIALPVLSSFHDRQERDSRREVLGLDWFDLHEPFGLHELHALRPSRLSATVRRPINSNGYRRIND